MSAQDEEKATRASNQCWTASQRTLRLRWIMKNAFRFGLLIITIISTSSLVYGQSFNKGGRTALQFLKIGIGARQAALGEANIAAVSDVNSIFWDPAGLTGIKSAEASADYTSWFGGMNYYAGAAGFRIKNIGVFGLDFASLSYGNIPEALVSVPSGSNDTRTGNTFTGGDVLLGVAYSHDFTDQLSIGIAGKYLRENLFTYTTSSLAFDVGTLYNVGYKNIHVAMSAQNFAGTVKWLANSNNTSGYELPLLFRIGMSFGLLGGKDAFVNVGDLNRMDVSVDAVHSNDYSERLDVGGEYVFDNFLSLRAGYRFNYTEGNLSLGFGLKTTITGVSMEIDYAYTQYTYLESPNRLTVMFDF